ncbi:hypothetical protein B566_EDAN011326 [Ephemera danica]|nr:hypothetical protein B566_EDAN011326 [Ephemera danica]
MSNVVAIDVEMVQGAGPGGNVEIPAKVAVVNSSGGVLMETFVQPRFRVTDYRSEYSGGITAAQLASGHDLQGDLKAFELTHNNTRDTATYPPFVERYGKGQKPKLRELAVKELQDRTDRSMSHNHDPVEDAQMAMRLFMKYKNEPW